TSSHPSPVTSPVATRAPPAKPPNGAKLPTSWPLVGSYALTWAATPASVPVAYRRCPVGAGSGPNCFSSTVMVAALFDRFGSTSAALSVAVAVQVKPPANCPPELIFTRPPTGREAVVTMPITPDVGLTVAPPDVSACQSNRNGEMGGVVSRMTTLLT